ncbi:MAG: hypothetical protein FJX75_28585 [Armatimonadetes bacterium]|nr:hypothetical protein [Armatimonadota bacterium]
MKTQSLGDCEITANVALFAADHWLTSPCLASTKPSADAPNPVAEIRTGTSDWTRVEATLGADLIPDETKNLAFYIDAKGEGAGSIWFDELDLWQN